MAYPTAVGVSSLSGILIPEIWSLKTLIKFYAATVFGEIANTDYEGEITKHGDKVIIRTIPDISIRDYKIGQGLQYDRMVPSTVELLVDKGKYYGLAINNVEKAQSDLQYMDDWATDAAQQLKISIDTDILAVIPSDAAATNAGLTAGKKSASYNLGVSGTPREVTKENILDVIVDLGSVLDEQDVPETGRYIVMPPKFCGMVKKSDLKDASMTGDGVSLLRNGKLGMIDRFTLYSSNNVATATDGSDKVYNIIAGQKSALTFASQLINTEIIDNQTDFGKLMRGLQVYGYEVIKPEALAHLYAKAA